MEVHKVGYQSTYLNHTQLRAKQEIILSKDIFVPISKTLSGSELTIGYKEKEKLKEDFHLNIYKNYETGVAFKYEEEYEGKTITGIRLRAYFIGGKGFPLRVNLYDLDEDGLPKNILLKEELVIRPTDKKEWFELELSKQGITFPKSGVAITIEPLNPQMRRVRLNKEYRPVLSSFVSEDFKWVYRGNAWPVWKTGGGKTYAMQLKMR